MAAKFDQMRKGTTSVAILKLLVDEDEPLHGYEIIRRVEERSQGYFRFKEGLIYPGCIKWSTTAFWRASGRVSLARDGGRCTP